MHAPSQVYVHHLCAGALRGWRVSSPWSWNSRWLCVSHLVWELNSGSLQEQCELLASEPALQPPEMAFSNDMMVSALQLVG